MNPFVLYFSTIVNLLTLGMYLLFWYVLPVTAIALVIFTVIRLLIAFIRWVRDTTKSPESRA